MITLEQEYTEPLPLYTNKGLRFLLADLQLWLLVIPFSSLFTALPELDKLAPLVNLLSAALMALSAAYLLLSRRPSLRTGVLGSFALFAAFFLLSVTWAEPAMRSNSFYFILRTVFVAVQAFVIARICSERQSLPDVLLRLAVVLTIVNFLFLIVFPDRAVWTVDETPRMQGIFASPNNMGQFLGFAAILVNCRGRRVLPFAVWIGLNGMLLFQFLRCDSMTSLAGVVLILFLLRWKRTLMPFAVCLFLLGLAMPYVSTLQKDAPTSLGMLNRDLTFTGRSEVWDILRADVAQRHREWMGFGAGGYWTNDINEFNPLTHVSELDWDPGQGHNGYLDLRVSLGWLGLALFAFFLFRLLHQAFHADFTGKKAVLALLLLILFNNLTESSLFREKHFYDVLFLLLFWHVQLDPSPSLQDKPLVLAGITDETKSFE